MSSRVSIPRPSTTHPRRRVTIHDTPPRCPPSLFLSRASSSLSSLSLSPSPRRRRRRYLDWIPRGRPAAFVVTRRRTRSWRSRRRRARRCRCTPRDRRAGDARRRRRRRRRRDSRRAILSMIIIIDEGFVGVRASCARSEDARGTCARWWMESARASARTASGRRARA